MKWAESVVHLAASTTAGRPAAVYYSHFWGGRGGDQRMPPGSTGVDLSLTHPDYTDPVSWFMLAERIVVYII